MKRKCRLFVLLFNLINFCKFMGLYLFLFFIINFKRKEISLLVYVK